MAEIKERPPTNQEITLLRERTMASVTEMGEDLVDARDLSRVLTDDKYISRFFRHCILSVPGKAKNILIYSFYYAKKSNK